PGDPDLAVAFAGRRADRQAVPGDINIARGVRGDAAAAIQDERLLHQVPLWLKRCAGVVQPRVEHRHAVVGAFRQGVAGAVPGDVDPVPLAQGELRAPNRADGDGAARLAVDAKRFGEFGCARLAVDIVSVAGALRPLEVHQVQDAG